MKRISMIFTVLMALFVSMPTMAQEKKKLDWKDGKMPALTNVKDINDYLLTCDTIINHLKAIDENLVWYKVQEVQCENSDGTISKTYHIVNEKDPTDFRGKDAALKQTLDVISVCIILPLEAANIGVQTPLYTMALPQLGLGAVKYAKYSKLGPQLAARCATDVVQTLAKLRKQGKAIRALKKMTNQKGELTDPNIDISKVEGMEDFVESGTVQKTSDELAAILAKEQAADSNVGDIDESALDIE